ncbi:hypothetical protein EDF35_3569 [Rathayibacter sp. PhB151]|uniref:Fic family protein n=1 Tax=Rathayibacter sp. PhB151 TaxID=2485189 RepID=UPI0010DC7C01|nr:hypothetical protein [Rathayibacter sp. PhB151]TDX76031.1 hypothetical protein EDF35_3569 [Rathayibacter sp. PhB151]
MTDVQRPGPGYRRRPEGGRTDGPAARSLPAADSALLRERTGITWTASTIEWNRLVATTSERARFRFRASLPDLVWNAAALEGNTFTLPEVRTLLEGVTVGGKPLADEEQVLALSQAYSDLDQLVGRSAFALRKDVSDTLHRTVAEKEAIESGHFRGEGTVSGGGSVRLANGGFVAGVEHGTGGEALIERFDSLVRFLETLPDPRERAVAYFAAATRSQFYFDGNKRTARLMMTGVLMSAGIDAVNIPYSRRLEFNRALDELFETDDATALMRFIVDCA